MLRLDRVIRPWKESGALNSQINLYGFWNETAFLTKSGDLGMVLQVQGVDYESLDTAGQEYSVKRLESALKAFGQGFHVYQYLFKANRPEIPFANYDDPIVEAAVEQRRRFFESKRDNLYQLEIFYVVILEGARSKRGGGSSPGKQASRPRSVAQHPPDPWLAVVPHLSALFVAHTAHPLVRARHLLRAHADKRQ